MHSVPLSRFGLCISAVVISVYIILNLTVGSVAAQNNTGKIDGPPEVQSVLKHMRTALGGEEKLGAIKTIFIRTIDVYGPPIGEQPIIHRISLPDAYQYSLENRDVTFTVTGKEFWRKPGWEMADTPRSLIIRRFTNMCLLLLGQSSGLVAMSASIDKEAPAGITRLILTGDVKRSLELDSEWRPRVLEHPIDIYDFSGSVRHTTMRSVVEKWNQKSGLWSPALISEAALPDAPKTIRFDEILVNERVSNSDFTAPVTKK